MELIDLLLLGNNLLRHLGLSNKKRSTFCKKLTFDL